MLIGRPILYALAKGGQAGVEQAIGILKTEFQMAMALAGCPNLHAPSPSIIAHVSKLPLRSAL